MVLLDYVWNSGYWCVVCRMSTEKNAIVLLISTTLITGISATAIAIPLRFIVSSSWLSNNYISL